MPVTFIGYAFINGSAFVLDISLLWVMYEHLHWFYPLAVSVGYAAAGLYSLILNRWLNFQARGHLAAQGSRYLVGLASQYVLFILGLSSLLHWAGVNAELARVVSACCEGVYLYRCARPPCEACRRARGPSRAGDGPAMAASAARPRRASRPPSARRPHQKARAVSAGPSSSVKPASTTDTGLRAASHRSRSGKIARTR